MLVKELEEARGRVVTSSDDIAAPDSTDAHHVISEKLVTFRSVCCTGDREFQVVIPSGQFVALVTAIFRRSFGLLRRLSTMHCCRSIKELQEQNQKLLAVVRELSEANALL